MEGAGEGRLVRQRSGQSNSVLLREGQVAGEEMDHADTSEHDGGSRNIACWRFDAEPRQPGDELVVQRRRLCSRRLYAEGEPGVLRERAGETSIPPEVRLSLLWHKRGRWPASFFALIEPSALTTPSQLSS